jgi:hypothetical protein
MGSAVVFQMVTTPHFGEIRDFRSRTWSLSDVDGDRPRITPCCGRSPSQLWTAMHAQSRDWGSSGNAIAQQGRRRTHRDRTDSRHRNANIAGENAHKRSGPRRGGSGGHCPVRLWGEEPHPQHGNASGDDRNPGHASNSQDPGGATTNRQDFCRSLRIRRNLSPNDPSDQRRWGVQTTSGATHSARGTHAGLGPSQAVAGAASGSPRRDECTLGNPGGVRAS